MPDRLGVWYHRKQQYGERSDQERLASTEREMKITIWGINYAPEPTGIGPYNTDLAEFFHGRGHVIRAITTFPYYPHWRKKKGDEKRLYRREIQKGVEILRCWHYVPPKPTAWTRMLHEASFIFTSFWRLLFAPRPDLVLVVSPPLLLGPAAWLIGLVRRCPFSIHVQDMQPDAAIALGLLRPGMLTSILHRIERFSYRRAAMISGITRGMLSLLGQKGISSEKQYLLPNWILQRGSTGPIAEPVGGSFRQKHQIPPRNFLVVYSGNVGKKQGLDTLLDAAFILRSNGDGDSILILLVGEGAAKHRIQLRIEKENLPVRLLPLLPEEDFQAMLQDADLCVVSQEAGSGSLFFPSKLITLLAATRPILSVADHDSELALALEEGRFGRNVPPGDPSRLAWTLAELEQNRKGLPLMARRGHKWVQQFSREKVLETFAQHLESRFQGVEAPLRAIVHEPY
jgi:colanic acid biosynthesis glycosyl transferase WcaI